MENNEKENLKDKSDFMLPLLVSLLGMGLTSHPIPPQPNQQQPININISINSKDKGSCKCEKN